MSDETTTAVAPTPYFKNTFAEIALFVDEREPDCPAPIGNTRDAFRYDKDIESVSAFIIKRGDAPEVVIEGEDFLVPAWDWAEKGMNVDSELFRLIDGSVPMNPEYCRFYHVVTQDVVSAASLPEPINPVPPFFQVLFAAIGKLERHNIFLNKIILGSDLAEMYLKDAARYGTVPEEEESVNELTPIATYVNDIPVYATQSIPVNVGYIVTEPHLLGVLPYNPANGHMGMSITNPKGIVKIQW